MATVEEVRTAVKTIVEAATDNLKVYPKIPGDPTSRALIVRPATASFVEAMGRGTDTWQYDLIVMLTASDLMVAQKHLDEYVDGSGTNSIRSIIFTNRTLGLANTDAHISGVISYGPLESVVYEHVGAVLRMVVHTKPA